MQTIPALNTGSRPRGFFATYVAHFPWQFIFLLTDQKQNSLVGWIATTLVTRTIASRAPVTYFSSTLPLSHGDQRNKLWLPYPLPKQSLWPLPPPHKKLASSALSSL